MIINPEKAKGEGEKLPYSPPCGCPWLHPLIILGPYFCKNK